MDIALPLGCPSASVHARPRALYPLITNWNTIVGKHGVLKSVAHNWAEHLLSDWIFVDDTIMIQHLLEAARICGTPTLVLDPLAKTLELEQCKTSSVMKGIEIEVRQNRCKIERHWCDGFGLMPGRRNEYGCNRAEMVRRVTYA